MFEQWFRPFFQREDAFAGIEVILPETEPAYGNRIAHRNFNECLHCRKMGEEGLLWRYSECFPMISRSDGNSFHLYLADAPRPFPAERSFRATPSLTLCFLYQLEGGRRTAGTVLVFLDSLGRSKQNIYRRIEDIADLLSDLLLSCGSLEGGYDFRTNIPETEIALIELSYGVNIPAAHQSFPSPSPTAPSLPKKPVWRTQSRS